jgi:hypothetical protein
MLAQEVTSLYENVLDIMLRGIRVPVVPADPHLPRS